MFLGISSWHHSHPIFLNAEMHNPQQTPTQSNPQQYQQWHLSITPFRLKNHHCRAELLFLNTRFRSRCKFREDCSASRACSCCTGNWPPLHPGRMGNLRLCFGNSTHSRHQNSCFRSLGLCNNWHIVSPYSSARSCC